MAYKALYRTYRPTTFEEVAGQSHIVKTLQNALVSNKIAHAYLFCGPRGTGKTTMAKLLAKALNCEEGKGHQCNKCPNCLAINDGSHPDVIEIDAASNNGVEDVRDIIDRVKYAPMKGKYKIYIIDEVHMMSPSAFNALLKTLEEPPAHVIFILATTEPHKILPTILSRCQRFDFSKVDDVSLKHRLKEVLTREKIDCEESALDLIISLSDGGVRDALSLLDQSIAYSGGNIKLKDIEDIFGLISISERIDLLSAVIKGNVEYVLKKTKYLIDNGVDIVRLTQDILDILKDIVIYNKCSNKDILLSLEESQAKQLCSYISSEQALRLIEILLKAQSQYKVVNNIKSLFEMTILQMTSLNNNQDDVIEHSIQPIENPKPIIKEIKKEPEHVEQEIPGVTPIKEKVQDIPQDEPLMEPLFQMEEEEEELPPFMIDETPEEKEQEVAPISSAGTDNIISDDDILKLMVLGSKQAKTRLLDTWSTKLESLLLDNRYGKYASILKAGKPYILTKDFLILQYDFAHQVKKLNFKENQEVFQKIVNKINGNNVKVYGILRKNAVDIYKKYQDLSQLGKLPKPNEIVLNINI